MFNQDANGPDPDATLPPDEHPDPVQVAEAIVEAAEVRRILDMLVVNHRVQLAGGADELTVITSSARAFFDLEQEKAAVFMARLRCRCSPRSCR